MDALQDFLVAFLLGLLRCFDSLVHGRAVCVHKRRVAYVIFNAAPGADEVIYVSFLSRGHRQGLLVSGRELPRHLVVATSRCLGF